MQPSFGFLDLSTTELIIILIIVLLLFGGKKLPELTRSINQSIRELRGGFKGEDTADKSGQKPNKKA